MSDQPHRVSPTLGSPLYLILSQSDSSLGWPSCSDAYDSGASAVAYWLGRQLNITLRKRALSPARLFLEDSSKHNFMLLAVVVSLLGEYNLI